jgi:hypothetical protein
MVLGHHIVAHTNKSSKKSIIGICRKFHEALGVTPQVRTDTDFLAHQAQVLGRNTYLSGVQFEGNVRGSIFYLSPIVGSDAPAEMPLPPKEWAEEFRRSLNPHISTGIPLNYVNWQLDLAKPLKTGGSWIVRWDGADALKICGNVPPMRTAPL